MTQFESFSGQLIGTISVLQEQLDELSLKQQDLHNLITDSRDGSLTEEEYADVKMMMDKTTAYNSKLLSLRTTMVNMSLKSKQLRKRSDKLKATKLDYLSKVESIRRLEQERDLSIAAKVSDPIVLDDQQQQQQQQQRIGTSSQSPSPSTSSPISVSSPTMLDTLAPAVVTLPPTGATAAEEDIAEDNNNTTQFHSPTPTSPPLEHSDVNRTASTLSLTTTPTATIPSSPLSPASSSIAMAKKKKKKKPKAREVEIGGDDDGPAWIPKRTFSTTHTKNL